MNARATVGAVARRLLRAALPRPIALWLRREWIARNVVNGRGYRERDVSLVPRLVRPGDVCWDIGANSGTYTLPMARLASRVVAFEPVPHNQAILRQVLRLGGVGNVEVSAIALADVVGRARVAVPPQGFYGGFYLAALDPAGELTVETSTVDALIAAGTPEPDFVKCDVEGAEGRVIDGALDLIARRHPVWLIETFEEAMLARMESLGYAAHVHREDGEIVPVARRTAARNYLFLPRSS